MENRSQAPMQIDWVTYQRNFDLKPNLVEFLVYARRGFEPFVRIPKKIYADVYESDSKIVQDDER